MSRCQQILALLLLLFGSASCAVGTSEDSVEPSETNLRSEFPNGGPADRDVGTNAPDVTTPEMTSCQVGSCEIGEVDCRGMAVITCEAVALQPGCGMWSAPVACPTADETCIEGVCQVPTGCVDNDGDQRGLMCAAGDDCDDAQPLAYVGADEICDGIDNNCDGSVDEGYQLGTTCTYGAGSCQADGVIVCGPDGGTICSGMATGEPEICDGIDNDCNGIVDDGVCTACQGDIFEPNDAPGDATLITAGNPEWGYVCPGDTDWFDLETQTGVTYHIYVAFPEQRSDLLVRGWVDGVNVVTGDTAGRDYEVFVVNGDAAKSFQIEVVDRDGVESFFRISLVTDWACGGDDGFTPNQSIATASVFPPFWLTTAFICSGGISDWYSLGDLTAGEALYAGIAGESFGTDLDLHLWGDPDGDAVFERMANSANFDNVEEIDIPVPHTGRFFLEVVDFDGYGGSYDIGWTVQ